MLNSRYAAPIIALFVPILLFGGALVSQYGFGLYPCEMCYWQRWPHQVAIIFAVGALVSRRREFAMRNLTYVAAGAIALSGLIGTYHAGVEYGFWEGLTTCATGSGGGTVSLDSIMNAPLIRCDQPQWTLFGISLAGFNAIFSLGAAVLIWILLGRRTTSAT